MPLAESLRDLGRGRDEDPEVGLALLRERCRERDEDRVGLAHLVVVGRRGDEALLDERPEHLGRDVLDVALARVEHGDAVGVDVDEQHALAGVGEHAREREPDVPGPDDGDVAAHRLGIVACSTCAVRSEACPSPYRTGRNAGIDACSTASTSASGSSSTSVFAPSFTVSTHSVDGLGVTHGTPYQYASFWRPPESVTITRACDASDASSR